MNSARDDLEEADVTEIVRTYNESVADLKSQIFDRFQSVSKLQEMAADNMFKELVELHGVMRRVSSALSSHVTGVVLNTENVITQKLLEL